MPLLSTNMHTGLPRSAPSITVLGAEDPSRRYTARALLGLAGNLMVEDGTRVSVQAGWRACGWSSCCRASLQVSEDSEP